MLKSQAQEIADRLNGKRQGGSKLSYSAEVFDGETKPETWCVICREFDGNKVAFRGGSTDYLAAENQLT